jgi:hypothetical protein
MQDVLSIRRVFSRKNRSLLFVPTDSCTFEHVGRTGKRSLGRYNFVFRVCDEPAGSELFFFLVQNLMIVPKSWLLSNNHGPPADKVEYIQ